VVQKNDQALDPDDSADDLCGPEPALIGKQRNTNDASREQSPRNGMQEFDKNEHYWKS
jgi:hypothetical protein